MKYLHILLLLVLVLPLQACKHGARTVPELSAKLFEALKSGSEKAFFKTAPTISGYEEAFETFYVSKYADKAMLQKEARNKAASVHLNLANSFRDVIAEAKEKPIDWKKTRILDLKYNVKDRKEGFKEAKVRMILETGIDKNVILFDAIRIEKLWYVVENLKWEE